MASSAVLRLAKTSGAFANLCRKDVSRVLCSPSSTRLRPGAGPRPQPRWRPAGASPGQRPRARPQQGEQLLCRVSAFSRSAWGCPCAGGAGATAPQGAHFPLYGLLSFALPPPPPPCGSPCTLEALMPLRLPQPRTRPRSRKAGAPVSFANHLALAAKS